MTMLISGCHSQEQKRESALQSARSSASAAAFSGEAWVRNNVTDKFARDAFKSAAKSLEKSLQSPLPPAASQAIKQAHAAASAADSAIEHHDRKRVTLLTRTLSCTSQALDDALRHEKQ